MAISARSPEYPTISGRNAPLPSRVTKLKLRLWEDPRPQYEIAGLIGVSPPRLSDYANAVRPIPQRRIIQLCDVLQCRPEDIIGFEDV